MMIEIPSGDSSGHILSISCFGRWTGCKQRIWDEPYAICVHLNGRQIGAIRPDKKGGFTRLYTSPVVFPTRFQTVLEAVDAFIEEDRDFSANVLTPAAIPL